MTSWPHCSDHMIKGSCQEWLWTLQIIERIWTLIVCSRWGLFSKLLFELMSLCLSTLCSWMLSVCVTFCLVMALFSLIKTLSDAQLYYAESIVCIWICYMLVDGDWSHVQTDSVSIIHSGHGKWEGKYIITWHIIVFFISEKWKIPELKCYCWMCGIAFVFIISEN